MGRTAELSTIGIDTEVVVSKQTREQVILEIASENEWRVLDSLDLSYEQIFSVVFSAKEAFFKCCYPLVKQYFGFENATVVDASNNHLQIQTHSSHPQFENMPSSLTVHYLATQDDVFTITWMEPSK